MRAEEKRFEEKGHRHLLAGWRFSALVLIIAVAVAGYFLFSLWGDWDKVVAAIYSVGIVQVAISLFIAILSYLFRFTRWEYFLHTLGHSVPLMRSLRIYIAGFSLTTTPGKAGEALRSLFLSDEGIAYRRSFGALFAERFSDFLAVVLLAAGGLAFFPAASPVLFISLTFVAALLFAVQKDRWLKGIEAWVNHKFEERFAHIVEFFIETIVSFRACFTVKVLLVGTLLGMVAWGLEGLILYGLLKVQGVELPLYAAIFIHAFSLLIGALTLLPGGLGATEAVMYQLLAYNDVPTPIAVSTILLLRLFTLWFSVFLGLLALPKKEVKLR